MYTSAATRMTTRLAASRLTLSTSLRGLHASSRVLASSASPDPLSDPRIAEFASKIQNHQGAREAMLKIGELMQAKGIDLSTPPSTMQMLKLGMDSEIRAAGQKLRQLMTELQAAGIEINPETASQLFSKFNKP